MTPSHLLCEGPGCYHRASLTHVRDRNFKSSLIHSSAIIRFSEFAEFSESYAPFRENPITHVVPLCQESRFYLKVPYMVNLRIKNLLKIRQTYIISDRE